jgi:predicted transcriptional regulator
VTLEAISFRADPELVDNIEAIAAAEGKTVSEVVREMMQRAVEREARAAQKAQEQAERQTPGRYRLVAGSVDG